MPARRSPRSPGRPTGATCKRSARRSSEEEFSDEVPGGLQYRGEYLIPVGEATRRRIRRRRSRSPDGGIAAPEVWLDTVRDFTIAAMMQEIREDLQLLGVDQDVFSSERALVDSGAADALDRLAARATA